MLKNVPDLWGFTWVSVRVNVVNSVVSEVKRVNNGENNAQNPSKTSREVRIPLRCVIFLSGSGNAPFPPSLGELGGQGAGKASF